MFLPKYFLKSLAFSGVEIMDLKEGTVTSVNEHINLVRYSYLATNFSHFHWFNFINKQGSLLWSSSNVRSLSWQTPILSWLCIFMQFPFIDFELFIQLEDQLPYGAPLHPCMFHYTLLISRRAFFISFHTFTINLNGKLPLNLFFHILRYFWVWILSFLQ